MRRQFLTPHPQPHYIYPYPWAGITPPPGTFPPDSNIKVVTAAGAGSSKQSAR